MADNQSQDRQQQDRQQQPAELKADTQRQATKATDAAAEQVQTAVDVETEQGFRGVEVDPTPNENYTLEGQNAGAPTPETDKETAKKAAQAQEDVSAQAAGTAEQ